MAFPSPHAFVDPPNNWNQQNNYYHQPNDNNAGGGEPAQFPTGFVGLPPVDDVGGARPVGQARPTAPSSMSERARQAKIPQPESSLKCPRCESTNTKFCYYNNYSLSQPRHFCKTCRRYWTRGGALRNVPVGGGFRRNKRSKASSKASSDRTPAVRGPSSVSTSSCSGAGAITPNVVNQSTSTLPVLAGSSSLHPLPEYMAGPPNLGLGFSGLQLMDSAADYSAHGTVNIVSSRSEQQIQQFPFLGGLGPGQQLLTQPQLFPFVGGGGDVGSRLFSAQVPMRAVNLVKSEGNLRGMSVSRNHLLGVTRNESIWAGGATGGSDGGWIADVADHNSII